MDFLFHHLKIKHNEHVTNDIMFQLQNFFDQPVKNNLRTYGSIREIAIGQGYDYTTGCLLDYNYFKNYYKMIAIDLSKQQALDADPKAIQQINLTGNLALNLNTTMFLIIEEAKEIVLDFSQELLKHSNITFSFNIK